MHNYKQCCEKIKALKTKCKETLDNLTRSSMNVDLDDDLEDMHVSFRMWDMSVRSQIDYFLTDLCGLSHSFVFPWKRTTARDVRMTHQPNGVIMKHLTQNPHYSSR